MRGMCVHVYPNSFLPEDRSSRSLSLDSAVEGDGGLTLEEPFMRECQSVPALTRSIFWKSAHFSASVAVVQFLESGTLSRDDGMQIAVSRGDVAIDAFV